MTEKTLEDTGIGNYFLTWSLIPESTENPQNGRESLPAMNI
jgi:hypothetical protein